MGGGVSHSRGGGCRLLPSGLGHTHPQQPPGRGPAAARPPLPPSPGPSPALHGGSTFLGPAVRLSPLFPFLVKAAAKQPSPGPASDAAQGDTGLSKGRGLGNQELGGGKPVGNMKGGLLWAHKKRRTDGPVQSSAEGPRPSPPIWERFTVKCGGGGSAPSAWKAQTGGGECRSLGMTGVHSAHAQGTGSFIASSRPELWF